ncbi:MAG: hypothetical protein ABJB78_07260, partial [Betaproteobacteria bacterium]
MGVVTPTNADERRQPRTDAIHQRQVGAERGDAAERYEVGEGPPVSGPRVHGPRQALHENEERHAERAVQHRAGGAGKERDADALIAQRDDVAGRRDRRPAEAVSDAERRVAALPGGKEIGKEQQRDPRDAECRR